MDFIVLGCILGAALIAAGLATRDSVPRRLPTPSDDQPWIEVRERRRLVRTLRSTGRMLLLVGPLVLLVTVILIVIDAADGTALATVAGVSVAGVILTAAVVVWFRYQESTGAIQRRQLRAISSRLGGSTRPQSERPPVASALDRRAVSDRREDSERRDYFGRRPSPDEDGSRTRRPAPAQPADRPRYEDIRESQRPGMAPAGPEPDDRRRPDPNRRGAEVPGPGRRPDRRLADPPRRTTPRAGRPETESGTQGLPERRRG